MTQAASLPQSASFSFTPNHIYEVTGIWIRPDMGQQIQEYFGKVFPIAAERYGVVPLFSLEPIRTYSGDFMPQMMFVNQWPSLDEFKSFVGDPDVEKLIPKRDAAAARLIVTHYEVPEESSVELSDGDVVEYSAMWIRDGKEEIIGDYYGKVFPLAMEEGVKPLTPLSPVDNYSGDFRPSRAGLLRWGKLENFDRFIQRAQPHVGQRDGALSRLEVVHAAVKLGGDK